MSRISNFFGGASPAPGPAIAPMPTATPPRSAAPVAEETPDHQDKKAAKQARAASENAAAASKEAASASAAAALASKQAASVANRTGGSGPSNNDVSLESNRDTAPAATPAAIARTRDTRASTPGAAASGVSVASVGGSTASSPALEASGTPEEANPAKAAKLIQDIDKIEKRVDRKNLSADDSQRDILAQKLLQEARKALAEHDSVAAMSLATKASTLLDPLPKLADSASQSTP